MSKKNKQTELEDYVSDTEFVDQNTGEIITERVRIAKEVLNKVIVKITKRPNGTFRIQQDFSNCPTLAEQHTAHLTDINYLMKKYKPDEVAAYIAARTSHRQEIMGHDFSNEPSLQDAKNVVYESRKAFEELPEEITRNFSNHLEFLKFIDNPANAEKMIKLGILKQSEIDKILIPEPNPQVTPQTTTTQEKEATKEQS